MSRKIALGQSVLIFLCALLVTHPAIAHEGHDHDKPPPLNLPVAPRVIAVTPEFELVGVISGENQLTIFLHEFATNRSVKDAQMTVSADNDQSEAKPDGDGIFLLSAPWLGKARATDLIFELKLSDGSEDLLTGRLEKPQSLEQVKSNNITENPLLSEFVKNPAFPIFLAASFVAGVLLTLFIGGSRITRRRQKTIPQKSSDTKVSISHRKKGRLEVGQTQHLICFFVFSFVLINKITVGAAIAEEKGVNDLPSIPSTMATDQPQRMPDGTLFIPKATQHLLSILTQVAVPSSARKAVELSGRIIVGPQNLGRIQSNRPGRFKPDANRVPFIGMSVKAGQILGYVETYIEAADKANIASQIAETEARIENNKKILKRFLQSKGAVPQVKIEETRGELEALTKRREELLPSTSAREPLIAPISGVISAANVVVGQVVESRDILFEIIDPSEFWIEAISADPGIVDNLHSGVAVLHHHSKPMQLKYLGRGLALRNHSNVLNFKIISTAQDLSVGMTARIILRSKETSEGFVLPASSVVRGPAGLPIVWIKTKAERFRPQTVGVKPFDGKSVVVIAGVKTDERVVTQGVTLLNQVR